MTYMEISIHDFMQTRLYYGPIRLKIGSAQQRLMKSPISSFNNISGAVYGIHGTPFTALCKPDFTAD
jgi:hypothetical protein